MKNSLKSIDPKYYHVLSFDAYVEAGLYYEISERLGFEESGFADPSSFVPRS